MKVTTVNLWMRTKISKIVSHPYTPYTTTISWIKTSLLKDWTNIPFPPATTPQIYACCIWWWLRPISFRLYHKMSTSTSKRNKCSCFSISSMNLCLSSFLKQLPLSLPASLGNDAWNISRLRILPISTSIIGFELKDLPIILRKMMSVSEYSQRVRIN